MSYLNPVIPGFYPDPSVCMNGKDYYLVASSFEYFPGVPLFHSRDLVNWKQIGHCLTRKSQLFLEKAKSSSGIFAPTIRFFNGKFYLITTNNATGRNFIVFTNNILGEWSDPVWLDNEGIDPSLFFDDDGKVYYTKTTFDNILQTEINIETGKIIKPFVKIWNGTGGRYPEAPHLYKINGRYYLQLAEGGTEYGHMVTLARSETPWGPFEPCPHNPVLSHRNRGTHPIQSTGHADMIQAYDGTWWMVFLGIRSYGYPPVHHLGRETFLAPVQWDQDGWPVVYHNGSVELEMETGEFPETIIENEEPRDDFNAKEFGHKWNYLRNPELDNYSFDLKPGFVCLKGSEVTLNDTDTPTFIGRRQQNFDFRAETLLEFSPKNDGEEAGLSVFMNEWHHYEIAIIREDGKNFLILRKRIGDLTAVVFSAVMLQEKLYLRITGKKEAYLFSYSFNGMDYVSAGTGMTKYLSTEVAGGFTGVYIGIYATGNGKKSATWSFFDWFDYQSEVTK